MFCPLEAQVRVTHNLQSIGKAPIKGTSLHIVHLMGTLEDNMKKERSAHFRFLTEFYYRLLSLVTDELLTEDVCVISAQIVFYWLVDLF